MFSFINLISKSDQLELRLSVCVRIMYDTVLCLNVHFLDFTNKCVYLIKPHIRIKSLSVVVFYKVPCNRQVIIKYTLRS